MKILKGKLDQAKLKDLYIQQKISPMFSITSLKKFKEFIGNNPELAKHYNLLK